MKTFLQILFFCLLFLIPMFSQNKGSISDKPDTERLPEILKSSNYKTQGLNDLETLLKFKSSTGQTTLRNLKREFYEEGRFYAKDTRTTINKTLPGSCFLLIEIIYQERIG